MMPPSLRPILTDLLRIGIPMVGLLVFASFIGIAEALSDVRKENRELRSQLDSARSDLGALRKRMSGYERRTERALDSYLRSRKTLSVLDRMGPKCLRQMYDFYSMMDRDGFWEPLEQDEEDG